jgi:outer membrane protein TolC
MRAIRRALFACAVAGVMPATGCTTSEPFGEGRAPQIRAQEPATPRPIEHQPAKTSTTNTHAPLELSDKPLPINLATALRLANARPLDVQIAERQVIAAVASYDRARLLWVPNFTLGVDYFLHTGGQQNFVGELPKSNRNTFMAGFGPNVVFAFSDAIYAPLAARQELRARQAMQQTAANDSTLAVAEAYFAVQQARGELAGALAAEAKAEEVVRKATALAKGLAPPAEENRARTELGRRKIAVANARERWRTASAELTRLLRLDSSAVVEPAEPPVLPVTVIDATVGIDELIPLALNTRPELASNQAFVQATLARLKQEKLRPLVPSLAVRSVSTNPSGSLGYGTFGGGRSGELKDFGGRFDIDVQLLWEFQSLGFGNKARVNERRAEYEIATLELFRTQDRIAAEVAAAYAQVRATAQRLNDAEPALKEARDLIEKTVEGLGQTRRIGDSLTLVVRPQEAVAAVQAFAQANADFFAAVADYNRAQFRLYRALGHPAQCLAGSVVQPARDIPLEPVPETPPLAQLPPLPRVPVVEPSTRDSGEIRPATATAPPPAPTPLPVQEWSSVVPASDARPPEPPAIPQRPPVIIPERE